MAVITKNRLSAVESKLVQTRVETLGYRNGGISGNPLDRFLGIFDALT